MDTRVSISEFQGHKMPTTGSNLATQDLGAMLPYLAHALTESSLKMYARDIKAFATYAREHNLSTTEPSTLEAFRDDMIFNSSKSPHTINREIAAVKRVAKEAARHNLIGRDVAYDFANTEGASMKRLKDRMKHTKSIPISRAQMQQLCELPDTSTLVGMRDRALLWTLATSGIRASELASLRVDRLFHTSEGFFLQIMGKRDSEYRSANLSPEAHKHIVWWLKNRGVVSEFVFTAFEDFGKTPISRRLLAKGIWDVTKAYAKQVPGMEFISPHSFRRFLATELVKSNGIRVAQISLGHASIATTQGYDTSKLTIGVSDHILDER